jgi:hypothetical protein
MEKNIKSDSGILFQKNIKSPKASEMYAFANSKNGRTQMWLKDKESLARFLKTVGKDEYKVYIKGEYQGDS